MGCAEAELSKCLEGHKVGHNLCGHLGRRRPVKVPWLLTLQTLLVDAVSCSCGKCVSSLTANHGGGLNGSTKVHSVGHAAFMVIQVRFGLQPHPQRDADRDSFPLCEILVHCS